jgi:deoxyribodipyrimidine photolyase-related protein
VLRARSRLLGEKNGRKFGTMSNIVANDAAVTSVKMTTINLVFPHQLFQQSPLLENGFPIYLIEEFLFFKQYPFHQQKIAYHRATMQFYKDFLREKGLEVHYIESIDNQSDIRVFLSEISKKNIAKIQYLDTTDYLLERRISAVSKKMNIEIEQHPTQLFLNTKTDLSTFFRKDKKRYFHNSFYIEQRKKHQILVDERNEPAGGKWSFDSENRKKYPKGKTPPPIQYPKNDTYYEEAKTYVETHFSDHYGTLTAAPLYPLNYKSANEWLNNFLEQRFLEFGPYEDAIVVEQSILNHSVLTPMLNIGLLTPQEIIETTLQFSKKNDIPLNSTEGFVRQIIGWREFIRGMYEARGTDERTMNFWKFKRKIPKSFYNGTTGIPPIDETIKKLLKTGYSHHIERLMVLGNFMLLCEFDPDDVHQWFMEMYIDAYDWVMVPNVYGMSQFADGGLMATKPYISGSNYLKKMGNFKKGDWQPIWDGLFWRFMDGHRDFFLSNPRLGMLVRMFDKMDEQKREQHLLNAENYLKSL